MKLTDVFERTYILNLDERTDRLREMGEVLRKAGMPWQPGKVERFAAVRVPEAGDFPSVGSHGCYLSHLGILKAARDAGVSRCLIMEDDLDIAPEFAEVEDALARRLARDDWGFAYLGHDLPAVVPAVPPGTLVPVEDRGTTNHFFAIHGSILDDVIAFLELILTRPAGHPDGGPMHVDGAFTTFRQQNPGPPPLFAQPNLGRQRSSSSDITGRSFDRWPVVGDLLRVVRNVRRRVVPPRA